MKSFSIKNFKSFAKEQSIPIKPITLIYGANSAGKSSIIQSFLLLNQIMKTSDSDVTTIQTPWDSLDLGGYRQYSYRHEYKNKAMSALKVGKSFVSERQGLKA